MLLQRSPSRKSTRTRPTAVSGGPLRARALVACSVSLCALPLLTSCIVDEPPDFEDPQRTAPTLYLDKSDPPNTNFVQVASNSTLPFSIWLQSEDLREPLVAIPWVNFGL